MDKSKRKLRGFTLLELVVVMAIIGILAAILVPNILDQIRTNKILTANDRAQQVYMAAQEYLISEQIKGKTPEKIAKNADAGTICWLVVSTQVGSDSTQADTTNITKIVDYYNIKDASDSATENYIEISDSGVSTYPMADGIESRMEAGINGSWMVAFYPSTFTVAYACFNDFYDDPTVQAKAVKLIGTNNKADASGCTDRLYKEVFKKDFDTDLAQESDIIHPNSKKDEDDHCYTGQFPIPGVS